MPTTICRAGVCVMGLLFSLTACAPPTPKVEQRPTAVPQSIEQKPQDLAREVDRSLHPMVREGSVTTPDHHG